MATAKTEDKKVNPVSKPQAPAMVQLFIPRGVRPDDPDVFISINGVNYLLPRGKTSVVPDYVAAEYHRAEAAQAKYDKTSAERIYRGS